jgi:hypothetical protein
MNNDFALIEMNLKTIEHSITRIAAALEVMVGLIDEWATQQTAQRDLFKDTAEKGLV